MPYFRSACVTALGMAWKSGVAAEVLCQPRKAIGTQLYYAKIYLETENLFAWTAVVVLLSILMEKLFVGLMRHLPNQT
jgi:NitT/TauT family transport system permease protein